MCYTCGRQLIGLTAVKLVYFLNVLGAEFPQINRCNLVRGILLNKHSWTTIAVGECGVLIVHDGSKIILEALYISLVKSVLVESILETCRRKEKQVKYCSLNDTAQPSEFIDHVEIFYLHLFECPPVFF